MVTTHSLEHPPDKMNMDATTKRARMSIPMPVSSSLTIRTTRREAEMKAKQTAVLATLCAELDKAMALHVANMEAEDALVMQTRTNVEARAIKELKAKHADTVEGRAGIAEMMRAHAYMAIKCKVASPVVGAEMSPVEEDEMGPVVGAEMSPVEEDEMGPVESAVEGPVESAGMSPVEEDEMGPVENPVEGPVESTEENPVEGPVEGPVESAEMNPVESAVEGPVESAEMNPEEGPVMEDEMGPEVGPVMDQGFVLIDLTEDIIDLTEDTEDTYEQDHLSESEVSVNDPSCDEDDGSEGSESESYHVSECEEDEESEDDMANEDEWSGYHIICT